MNDNDKTVNKLKSSPWGSASCRTLLFANNLITTVPDISWFPNYHTSISATLRKTTNMSEPGTTNKYPHDSRLKFYQILQLNSTRNCVEVNQKISQNIPDQLNTVSQNYAASVKNDNVTSPASERNLPIQFNDDLSKQHDHVWNKQRESIQIHNDSNISSASNFHCAHNNCKDDEIVKLLALVESQNHQLKTLKLQLNTLITNFRKYRENMIEMSSHPVENKMKSSKLMRLQQKLHYESEAQTLLINNSVPIDVMTNYEVNIQNDPNNLDMEDTSVYNLPSHNRVCAEGPFYNESMNLLKGPLEKIIEKSEFQFSARSNMHINDCDREKVSNHFVGESNSHLDKSMNESVKVTSSKLGWTFYNNMLCHINEILHNSNEVGESEYRSDITQKSNKERMKVMETTFTKITNAITSNITDNKITIDSSYYPKVNYQNDIIHTPNSTIDMNASIHIKALALKYLDSKYLPCNSLYELPESMNEFSDSRLTYDHMFTNTMSLLMRNMDKHELISPESFISNEKLNLGKQNILNVSILKRQRKLL